MTSKTSASPSPQPIGFIHHTRKDPTKEVRGSSALRTATDIEILVEGPIGKETVCAA